MSEPAAGGEDPVSDGRRKREPAFNLPSIIIVLIILCAGLHLLRTQFLTWQQDDELILRAAFIPIRYSGPYVLDLFALTSPVTYAFLHGDVAHLAINMIWLAAFGSPLANRLAAPRFLLFWIVTACSAALVHFLVHSSDPVPLVGASGAISGMMGAAARFGFRTDRWSGHPVFSGPRLSVRGALSSRIVIVFLTVWLVINLVVGLDILAPGGASRIAWEAHIGGFAAGFFGIAALDSRGDDQMAARR